MQNKCMKYRSSIMLSIGAWVQCTCIGGGSETPRLSMTTLSLDIRHKCPLRVPYCIIVNLLVIPVYTDYLDDVCGEKKLWPTDPYTRAQASLILDAFGNKVVYSLICHSCQNLFYLSLVHS